MTLRRNRGLNLSVLVLLLTLRAAGYAAEPAGAGADPHLKNLRAAKVLFLGNSITLHGPAEHIGWSGNWGMAASAAEKDYVHLLAERIRQATGCDPQLLVKNLADFERQFATYDLAAGLKDALDFQADLIIIALGENVPALATEEQQAAYRTAFVNLLQTLSHRGRPAIFVRSTFWTEPIRNGLMAQACRETGATFVALQNLDQVEANFARAERSFEHAGVAAHPGDRGMQAIADGIWQAVAQHAAGMSWPEFRGPAANGHAGAPGLPLTWSETENVTWKTPIHDLGWSSPVVWQNQIWVTTGTEDGTQLFAVCVDSDTGQIVQDVKVFDVDRPEHVAAVNSYASPTPVIEAGRLYVHYGTYGTACLDTGSGQVLWTRRDLNCDHHEGPGSSPMLYENLLIVHVDGRDAQYVVALDRATGQTVWKTNRSIDYSRYHFNTRKCFCTPIVIPVAGRQQLISPAAKAVMGYDPRTGEELWKIRYNGWSIAPRPLSGLGMVFLINDYEHPELWAIRPDGRGDASDTHVAWKITKGMPQQPSFLLVEGLIYLVNDDGVASCIEAKTGETVWKERWGGNFSASAIYADGRLYFFSRDAETTVLAPGRECKVLAVNQLDGELMASPAAAGKAFFLRTRTHLYRIENR